MDDKSKEIIETVLAIRAELPTILGEDAQTALEEIDLLLQEVSSNEEAEYKIWNILTAKRATRIWVTQYQSSELSKTRGDSTKNAASLPGDPSVIPTAKFKCPACTYTWSRHNVGRPIPICPDHQQVLIPIP
jgi:hypothetical protein